MAEVDIKAKDKEKKYSLKAPDFIFYALVYFVFWILSKLLFRASYKRTAAFRKHKGALIMIGNHASYLDIPFAIVAAGHKRINFVAGDFLYSKKTRLFLRLMQVIPKKQFQVDVRTMLLIYRALQSGRKVFIYPEAQRSIDGESGYLDPQFARLIKRGGVAVGIVRCRGCYLAWPRWTQGFIRPGKVVAESDILLTADEISTLEVDEIHEIIKDALNISDYDFQLSLAKPGKYITPAPAAGLENMLHHCPSCGKMQAIESTGKTLRCRQCHWKIELGLDGFFVRIKDDPFFDNPAKWHQWQLAELEKLFDGKPETVLSFPAACREHNKQFGSPSVQGTVRISKSKLCFQPDDGKNSNEQGELCFLHAGQQGGLFATYGESFRQYNSSGTWDFYPEIKSWPIIVHDWSKMGI